MMILTRPGPSLSSRNEGAPKTPERRETRKWTHASHVNEATEPVDNLGGLLSAVLVGGLIVSINFLPVPNETTLALVLLGIAAVASVLFVLRQRRASNPLYDLHIAARPTFWVAACAGIIDFGSLMGAAYISQQYLQNVLGYSTIQAGAAILPAGVFMVLVAPRSAKLVGLHGSRRTLLIGQALLFLAFLVMLLTWKENISCWEVAIPYVLLGTGIGLAGTPSSNSLTGSVPVTRVGMASGTADLQRDLGGALMTSVFGALLTATGRLAPSVAMTSVLKPLVGIVVGTLLLDERLADPTWHKVVAYAGLGLALAAAVSITRATEEAKVADAVDVDSSSVATPAT